MKTLSSIQLIQRALATEARLLAEQQQVLLMGKDVRDFMHLSKKDLLNLILGIRRDYLFSLLYIFRGL